MAVKLINKMRHDEFIDYIRNAEELDAWRAIGDAWDVVRFARISKTARAFRRRTLEEAMAAYKQTFGSPWAPF